MVTGSHSQLSAILPIPQESLSLGLEQTASHCYFQMNADRINDTDIRTGPCLSCDGQ